LATEAGFVVDDWSAKVRKGPGKWVKIGRLSLYLNSLLLILDRVLTDLYFTLEVDFEVVDVQ
jgi:hypothetical protein